MKILNGFAMLAIWLLPVFNKSNAQNKHSPAQKCRKEKQNDLSVLGLKGKVKRVETDFYDLIHSYDTVPMLNMVETVDYDTSGMWAYKKTEFIEGPGKGGFRSGERLYDRTGNIISETLIEIHNAADTVSNNRTIYTYDTNGRLTKISSVNKGSFYPAGQLCDIIYKYDYYGNCINENACGYEKVYQYDMNGNCIKMTLATKQTPESNTTLYTYDDKCNLTTDIRISTDTVKTNYQYDEKHNLVETNSVTNGNKSFTQYKYEYDDRGNQIKMVETSHGRFMISSWDKNGNPLPLKESEDISESSLTTTSYIYDSKGNWIEGDVMRNGKIENKMIRQILYY